jgi:hypothetical protein
VELTRREGGRGRVLFVVVPSCALIYYGDDLLDWAAHEFHVSPAHASPITGHRRIPGLVGAR